jgi:hypothetical protein
VKVIGAAVLSCLDDMYYRLPFPSQTELEKLIKDAQGETQMIEFRATLREDLNNPRALKEFESGWDKYWGQVLGAGLDRYNDVSPCCCPPSNLSFPSLSQLKILFI